MDETAIKKSLIELGVSPNLAGYRCLVHAIRLHITDPGQSLTKEIYPAIGQMCEPRRTGERVERLIRYAIDAAWNTGNEETWNWYFQQGKRPTNGEFISSVAEVLAVRKL